MGCVAAVMLVAGGDDPTEALSGLQRLTIIAALPFVVVMVLICVALTKDLYRDPLTLRRQLVSSVVNRSVRTAVEQHHGETFDLVTSSKSATPQTTSPGAYARAGVAADRED